VLSFKEFVTERWIRPTGDKEHDEVSYQADGDSSLNKLKDKQSYRNALRTGKEKIVPAYKWRKDNVDNTDAGERNIKSFQSLDAQKKSRVTKIVDGKRDIEMPIVHKKEDGSKSLLAGNTRSSRLALLGKPTRTLEIKGR